VLLKNGASLAAQDVNGRQAIHYVAQRLHPSTQKAMKIAEKILEETQNRAINQRDKRGTTPLMQACQKVPISCFLIRKMTFNDL
jgi:ankyrin repeat protein